MKKILIPRIGGDIGQGISRCLKESFPDIELVGEDRNVNCGWEAFVPEFRKEGSKEPTNAQTFPYWQSRLIRYICDDKLETQKFLEQMGLPFLKTYGAEDVSLDYYFEKPRYGNGHPLHQNGEMVSQEVVSGAEITCPVFRPHSGQVRVLQLERSLMGTFTSVGKVLEDPGIKEQCVKIAEALDVKGALNIQGKLDSKGSFKVFEINPRFSSTVYMRHKLGFKDAVWALEELNGTASHYFSPPAVGTRVVREQGCCVLSPTPGAKC